MFKKILQSLNIQTLSSIAAIAYAGFIKFNNLEIKVDTCNKDLIILEKKVDDSLNILNKEYSEKIADSKEDLQQVEKSLNEKILNNQKIFDSSFQEYKLRTNDKLSETSKKLYEINGELQVCTKLSKKNSRFNDALITKMINNQLK